MRHEDAANRCDGLVEMRSGGRPLADRGWSPGLIPASLSVMWNLR